MTETTAGTTTPPPDRESTQLDSATETSESRQRCVELLDEKLTPDFDENAFATFVDSVTKIIGQDETEPEVYENDPLTESTATQLQAQKAAGEYRSNEIIDEGNSMKISVMKHVPIGYLPSTGQINSPFYFSIDAQSQDDNRIYHDTIAFGGRHPTPEFLAIRSWDELPSNKKGERTLTSYLTDSEYTDGSITWYDENGANIRNGVDHKTVRFACQKLFSLIPEPVN